MWGIKSIIMEKGMLRRVMMKMKKGNKRNKRRVLRWREDIMRRMLVNSMIT
jgi:hypothetical protein